MCRSCYFLLDHGYAVERIVEAYPALTHQDIQAAIAFNETQKCRIWRP
ncbi:MAG: DUF433 domain-containing protein [Chloroflexota bacterium]|nr:MAG: DUF433 domain-containing protein [Chloroflexota bacterium]